MSTNQQTLTSVTKKKEQTIQASTKHQAKTKLQMHSHCPIQKAFRRRQCQTNIIIIIIIRLTQNQLDKSTLN